MTLTNYNANLDIDTTLGGDNASDYVIPSQKAIKDYVDNHSGGSAPVWGNILGTLSNQTDLQNVLNNLASELEAKQDILTSENAGTGISIDNGVISSTLTVEELSDLSDVSLSSPSSGQVLGYNGTNWTNVSASTPSNMVTTNTAQTISGVKTFSTNQTFNQGVTVNGGSASSQYDYNGAGSFSTGGGGGVRLGVRSSSVNSYKEGIWVWNQNSSRNIGVFFGGAATGLQNSNKGGIYCNTQSDEITISATTLGHYLRIGKTRPQYDGTNLLLEGDIGIDQTYSASSTNAQSGVAVAQALETKTTVTFRDWSS